MILENGTLHMISILLPYVYLECHCATIVQPGQCISLQAFHRFRFSFWQYTVQPPKVFARTSESAAPAPSWGGTDPAWCDEQSGMNMLRTEGRDTQRFVQKTKSWVYFLAIPDTAVSKANYRTVLFHSYEVNTWTISRESRCDSLLHNLVSVVLPLEEGTYPSQRPDK